MAVSGSASTAAGPALTSEELAGFAGLYRDLSTGIYGRMHVRDGRLWASMDAGDGLGDSAELRPIGPNRFSIPGAPVVVEFVSPVGGRLRQVQVTGAGPNPIVSEQVAEGFAPTAAELHHYAGSYVSLDLDVTYEVVAGESGLAIRIPGRPEIALQPVFPDAFYGSLVDLVRFTRGGDARATAFTINRATVRNLRFERVLGRPVPGARGGPTLGR
jgi:hypothetical protein